MTGGTFPYLPNQVICKVTAAMQRCRKKVPEAERKCLQQIECAQCVATSAIKIADGYNSGGLSAFGRKGGRCRLSVHHGKKKWLTIYIYILKFKTRKCNCGSFAHFLVAFAGDGVLLAADAVALVRLLAGLA